MPNSGYPFVAKVGQFKPPNWASSEYRNQQVIDGTRTFTLLDSQPCRLLILPSCYSSYGALNFYPGGTFTHCSCQPSLDAHFAGRIPNFGARRSSGCCTLAGA